MDMEIRAIVPRKPIVNASRVHRGLTEEMTRFVIELTGKFKEYPPQQPTKTGYRRTGTLKRSWFHAVESRPGLIVGRVASDPAVFLSAIYHPVLKSGRLGKGRRGRKPYAVYVMGKKQSALMKSRGWKKALDMLKKDWPGQVRKFQQVINRSK